MGKYIPKRVYTQDYKDFIKTVFKRDGFKCIICGSRKFIQAHHLLRYADHAGKRLDPNNSCTLCKTCHKKVTGNEYTYLPILKKLMYKDAQSIEDILDKYKDLE